MVVQTKGKVMAAQNVNELNETFNLLTHPHRRYVLYYLTKEFEVVDIETLAAAIAKWDGSRTATGGSDNSDDIEIGLRHTHLPKLVDAGVITFDADTGAIELDETNGHDRFIDEAARIDGYMQTVAADD